MCWMGSHAVKIIPVPQVTYRLSKIPAQPRLPFCVYVRQNSFIFLFFIFCLFVFSRTAPTAYGGSRARGLIEVVVTGLHHSHSNSGFEPCL